MSTDQDAERRQLAIEDLEAARRQTTSIQAVGTLILVVAAFMAALGLYRFVDAIGNRGGKMILLSLGLAALGGGLRAGASWWARRARKVAVAGGIDVTTLDAEVAEVASTKAGPGRLLIGSAIVVAVGSGLLLWWVQWGHSGFKDDATTPYPEQRAATAPTARTTGEHTPAPHQPEADSTRPTIRFREVSVGKGFVCALDLEGVPHCRGKGREGQLLAPAVKLDSISAGQMFACGLDPDGRPACWGGFPDARKIGGSGLRFERLRVGSYRACGLLADGHVTCRRQASLFSEDDTPRKTRFTALDVSGGAACGVLNTGRIKCWDVSRKVRPPRGKFTDVVTGTFIHCGIRADRTVECWGERKKTAPEGTFRSVTCGFTEACGIRDDGTIACWRLDGEAPELERPGSYNSISCHDHTCCGILEDRNIKCWGNELNGEWDSLPVEKAVSECDYWLTVVNPQDQNGSWRSETKTVCEQQRRNWLAAGAHEVTPCRCIGSRLDAWFE